MRKRKIKRLVHYDPTFKVGKLKIDNPSKFEKLFEMPDPSNATDGKARSPETMTERNVKAKIRKSP